MKLPSILSIKKPCQYFDRSCKTADRVTRFGKAPSDVNAIPSKVLPPIGKLVFYAIAQESRGTNLPVWLSDGTLAERCGVSRPSVVEMLRRLVKVGLLDKFGNPVRQIQGYQIKHSMFTEGSGRRGGARGDTEAQEPSKAAPASVTCPKCGKPRRGLLKVGWCRSCNSVRNTEKIARRVVREEIQKAEMTA